MFTVPSGARFPRQPHAAAKTTLGQIGKLLTGSSVLVSGRNTLDFLELLVDVVFINLTKGNTKL